MKRYSWPIAVMNDEVFSRPFTDSLSSVGWCQNPEFSSLSCYRILQHAVYHHPDIVISSCDRSCICMREAITLECCQLLEISLDCPLEVKITLWSIKSCALWISIQFLFFFLLKSTWEIWFWMPLYEVHFFFFGKLRLAYHMDFASSFEVNERVHQSLGNLC